MKFELDITSCYGYSPELEDLKKFLSKEFLDKLSKEENKFYIDINSLDELIGLMNDIKKTSEKSIDEIVLRPSYDENSNCFAIEIYDTYRE